MNMKGYFVMNALEIILGIIVLLLAVGITVMVIMQEGKQKNLSGAIAGGAESFFGKQKGKTVSKLQSFSQFSFLSSLLFNPRRKAPQALTHPQEQLPKQPRPLLLLMRPQMNQELMNLS